jgi:hypothetical protein
MGREARRGMLRQPPGEYFRLNYLIPVALNEKLDEAARKMNATKAVIVTQAIEAYLKKQEAPE